MPTITATATEICNRAGEGYANYSTRAIELFWKAVGIIIERPDFDENRIKAMYLDLDGTVVDIKTATSPIDIPTQITTYNTYYVWRKRIGLRHSSKTSVTTDMIHYSELAMTQFDQVGIMKSILSTVPKIVYYTVAFPKIHWAIANFSTPASTTNCVPFMRGYGVTVTIATTGATELLTYMDSGMINEAVEMATELLKQEIAA